MNELSDFALVGIIPFLPPRAQKIVIEKILETSKLKLNQEALAEYEDYWKRVQHKFERDYMDK